MLRGVANRLQILVYLALSIIEVHSNMLPISVCLQPCSFWPEKCLKARVKAQKKYRPSLCKVDRWSVGIADDLRVDGAQFSADRLVIGLNPPFGKNGSLANEFVSYAVDKFQPRMIVLIVPKVTKVLGGNDTDNGVSIS